MADLPAEKAVARPVQVFDMHEFQSFVYLAPQKTGTTFISAMLDEFCKEEQFRNHSHVPMGADYDKGKFYFISVRDPLDAYLSLYSYGSGAQGRMRHRFEEEGLGDLYDGTLTGFNEWLAYVLKPRKAAALDRVYAKFGGGATSALIGLQSYRYLRAALPAPETTLAACRTEDDIRQVYKEKKLPTYFVRFETFTSDLIALLRGPLRHAMRDVEAAVNYVETAPRLNTSERVDAFHDEIKLGKKLKRKLAEREWFLHEEFGY
jgi:hypothetical protein